MMREKAGGAGGTGGFPFPPHMMSDCDPFAPHTDGNFDVDHDPYGLGEDGGAYGKRSFCLERLTYGPQYKSTKKPSDRIEILLNGLLDRLERSSSNAGSMDFDNDENNATDSPETNESLMRELAASVGRCGTEDEKDRCIAAILVYMRIPGSKMLFKGISALQKILGEGDVKNGSYVLPLELMVRSLGEVLANDALNANHLFVIKALNCLALFSTKTLGYFGTNGFWKKFKSVVDHTDSQAVLGICTQFMNSVHKANNKTVLEEKLYSSFLNRFDEFKKEDQDTILDAISHAICFSSGNYGRDMLAIRKILDSKPTPLNRIYLELGIWAVNSDYDEYGHLFGEREFYELMKEFDSERVADVDKACTISMAIVVSAPEKVYDASVLLEKLQNLYFDPMFPAKYPGIEDLLCSVCEAIVPSVIPVAKQRPTAVSQVRGMPLNSQEGVIDRKSAMVYPETLKDGYKTFTIAMEFIKNFMSLYPDTGEQVYLAQAIINGLNYIHRNESEKFDDAVKSTNVLEFIASVALRSSNIGPGSLNSFSECILECADEPSLHELIKKTKVVEILQAGILRSMRSIRDVDEDPFMLVSKSISNICIQNLKELRSKLDEPQGGSADN